MAQWMINAHKLDISQQHFIFEAVNNGGNKWLRGLPGTGKSVLLIHLILAKIVENPNVFIAVVVFTNALRDMFVAAMQEAGVPYNNVYLTTYHKFIREDFKYEYIFCDEVQDLPQSILENMRKRAKQLIVAGDENQSIYIEDPQTREKVVDIRNLNQILNSNPYTLDTIYRLTKNIIKSVDVLKPDMQIKSTKVARKQDSQIRLVEAYKEAKEVEYVFNKGIEAIENWKRGSVAILLPSHKDIIDFVKEILSIHNRSIENIRKNRWGKIDYNHLNFFLKQNGINLEYLGNGYGDLYNANKKGRIILMTYHSSKGLDFDNVFLPFQSRDFKNLYFPNDYDGSAKKTLLMVGMTRAKKELYLTYSDYLPHDIEQFSHLCNKIDNISDLEAIEHEDNEFEFDF